MIPSHLYHYTSVDTLLLILSHSTIRFNTLRNMNDPIEGYTTEYPEARSYVFASCWTAEAREELPMWKMYTDLQGVRFKMPIDLFNTTTNLSVTKCTKSGNYLITSELDKPYGIDRENMDAMDINKAFGPTQIEYYESKDALAKEIITRNEKADFEMPEINLNLLGQRKLDYWRFEKEYRFRLFYANAIMLAGSVDILKQGFKNNVITTPHVDVSFNRGSLEGIEIILGPMTDKAKKEIIENHLNNLGITEFTVKYSEIEIQ